jgi:hypothetical protein
MKRLLVLALSAVPALLVAGAPARADFIPWAYSFSASPNPVTSDNGSASVTFAPTSGHESLSFNNLLAASLSAAGPADAAFTSRGYTMTMHLTDLASSASADLKWTGAFSGNSPLNLTNKVPNPSQQVTLGQHQYTVNLGNFVPPTSGKAGQLGVNVVVAGPSVPVNNAPEPASLLLAALGGSAIGLRAWWRRRGAKDLSHTVASPARGG